MDIRSRGIVSSPSEKTTMTSKTESKKAGEFGSALSAATVQKTGPAEKVPEFMEGLQALASQVKQGAITKEEASRHFVAMVISNRQELKSIVKDVKKLESAVADAIEQDPFFVRKLETQLKKIGQES